MDFINGTGNKIFISAVFSCWAVLTLLYLPLAANMHLDLTKLILDWRIYAFFIIVSIFFALVFFLLPKINQILSRASDLNFWTAIILFLLITRLAVFIFIPAPYLGGGDNLIFHNLATSLVESGTLVFTWQGISFSALMPPGYPLLLSIPYYLFGQISFWALLMNSAAFLLLLLGVKNLANALFSHITGRWAIVILALNPTLLLLASLAHKETLVASLAVWIAVVWMKLSNSIIGQSKWAVLGGALFGYLCIVQPSFTPLFILIAGSLTIRHGVQALRPLLLASLVAGLILGSWSWRNYQQLNAFVPLTTASGWTLWLGLNPEANGRWMRPPERFMHLTELEFSARTRTEAIDFLRHDPAVFFYNLPLKQIYYWGAEHAPPSYLSEAVGWKKEDIQTDIARFATQTFYTTAVILAAISVLLNLWRRAPEIKPQVSAFLTCISLIFVYQSVLHSFFEVGERHHYFLHPFLALLAAHFVHQCTQMEFRFISPAEGNRGG